MPLSSMKYFAFLCIGIILSIFTACDNKIEFTRLVQGKSAHPRDYNDSCYYIEKILVKNMPKDSLEQSKIMIAYFDSAGLSKDDFSSRMPEIRDYTMYFYKSTYATRKHFTELNEYWLGKKTVPKKISGRSYNGNETYLGAIWMIRCEDYKTKWRINFSRNLGTSYSFEHSGPEMETTVLINECNDTTPTYYLKKEELIKYYNDLIDKKKAKH